MTVTTEGIDVEKLLKWSKAKEVQTKKGPRYLRKAKLEEGCEFWHLWATSKSALQAAGISVSRELDNTTWSACWWQELSAEELAKRESSFTASRATDSDIVIPAPAGCAFLPFQKAGIAIATTRKHNLLADEMGLGKSVMALGLVNFHADIHRVLIVTKASLKANWYRECKKWLTRPMSVGIADASCFPSTDVVVINFDICHKFTKRMEFFWDLVVIDESHYVKNARSRRAKSIIGYKPTRNELAAGMQASSGIPARRKLMLTGTPFENKPAELYPLLRYLLEDQCMSKSAFEKKYCGAGFSGFGWQANGASNLEGLNRWLRETVMIRRLKRDVLKELPPKTRMIVELESDSVKSVVTNEQKVCAKYEADLAKAQVEFELIKTLESDMEYDTRRKDLNKQFYIPFNEISKVRHETALSKVKLAADAIQSDMDEIGSGKILVFAHHSDVLNGLAKHFPNSVTITGETSLADRDARVQRFQNDVNCGPFFGSIRATGEGLTLTAASLVIFVEEDWVPGKISQCEDRCVFAGQKVLTVNGWKLIEDVQIGDFVIGSDCKPHRVLDKWSKRASGSHKKNRKTRVELWLRGWNEPVVVTHDHLILTAAGWVEAANLRPSDKVKMPVSYDCETMNEIEFDDDCRCAKIIKQKSMMRRNNRWRPATQYKNSNLVVMPDFIKLTEDAMFVFGYFIGDGHANPKPCDEGGGYVSFSGHVNQKSTYLKRCAKWVEQFGIKYRFDHDDGLGCELIANSRELSKWFAKHFGAALFCSKQPKRLPEWIFNASKKQREAFFDGMMASDGHRPKNSKNHTYVTVSDRLASDAVRLMMSIGLKPCVARYVRKEGERPCYDITYNSLMPQELLVSSIEMRLPKDSEMVYDLEVEDSHDFVCGTAVVHNCHRIGQKDNVLVKHLVLKGTMDAKMVTTNVRKQEKLDVALDDRKQETIDEPVLVPRHEPLATRKELKIESIIVTPEQRSACQQAVQEFVVTMGENEDVSPVDYAIATELANRNLNAREAVLARKVCLRYKKIFQRPLEACGGWQGTKL